MCWGWLALNSTDNLSHGGLQEEGELVNGRTEGCPELFPALTALPTTFYSVFQMTLAKLNFQLNFIQCWDQQLHFVFVSFF